MLWLKKMTRLFNFLAVYEKKILVVIVLAVLGASLIYSFYYRIQPIVDARAYDVSGWNIAQGLGYFGTSPNPADDSIIRRPGPGYQYFLGGVYKIFGHHYAAVWAIQSLLHALSALLVFLIARIIFSSRWHPTIGLAAALLVGFSPDLITAAAMLMAENVGIFLMLVSIYLFFRFVENHNFAPLVFSALFLGLTVMVRSTILFLILAAVGYLVFNKNPQSRIRRFALLGLFLAVFGLTFVPWSIFTYRIYGEVLPLGANLGVNLLSGNHPGATGELDPAYAHSRSYDELGPVGSEKALKKDAMQFIINNPLEFARISFYRASMYFSFARPTGWWPYLSGAARVGTLGLSAFYSVVLFTLGFTGLGLALKGKEKEKIVLFAAMLVLIPLAIVFIVVETRYRYPVYPFFAIFAGYALVRLMANFRENSKSLFIALAVLGFNASFDVLRNWGRILERIAHF